MGKITLVLGSGGTRGFAHLGVLEVFEEENIKVGAMIGSSVGGMIASMYSFRPKIAPNLTHMESYLCSDRYGTTKLNYLKKAETGRKNFYDKMRIKFSKGAIFAASLAKPSLFDAATLEDNVSYLVPPVNIEDGFHPLGIVTFDITTGEEVLITSGNLQNAVMASCAIPGIFPAVMIDDRPMMDGGMVNPVPSNHASFFDDSLIVAVDVNPFPDPMPSIDNGYDMAMRAADISRMYIKSNVMKNADIIVSVELNDIFWADFSQFEFCVERGRLAAKKALPEIKQALRAGSKLRN